MDHTSFIKLLLLLTLCCALTACSGGAGSSVSASGSTALPPVEETAPEEAPAEIPEDLLAIGARVEGSSYISDLGFVFEAPDMGRRLDREKILQENSSSAADWYSENGTLPDYSFEDSTGYVRINYGLSEDGVTQELLQSSHLSSLREACPDNEIGQVPCFFLGRETSCICWQDGKSSFVWTLYLLRDGHVAQIFLAGPEEGLDYLLSRFYDTDSGRPLFLMKASEAREAAADLTEDGLVRREEGYRFRDLDLTDRDIAWVESERNTDHTVEAGAPFRSIGALLENNTGDLEEGSDWIRAARYVLGCAPASYEEYLEPARAASVYFPTGSYSLDDVLSPLLALSSAETTGTIDPSRFEYHFRIPDLRACAEEMGITQGALGCILAALEESGAKTSLEGGVYTYDSQGYDLTGSTGSGGTGSFGGSSGSGGHSGTGPARPSASSSSPLSPAGKTFAGSRDQIIGVLEADDRLNVMQADEDYWAVWFRTDTDDNKVSLISFLEDQGRVAAIIVANREDARAIIMAAYLASLSDPSADLAGASIDLGSHGLFVSDAVTVHQLDVDQDLPFSRYCIRTTAGIAGSD